MKKASELTDDEIRSLIAEDQGWKDCGYWGDEQHTTFSGITPHGGHQAIPPYSTCLNAMAEAESFLKQDSADWDDYGSVLSSIATMALYGEYTNSELADLASAPARQRAGAYCVVRKLALP